MPNIELTLRQIEDIFQNLTIQMLGLDPVLPENQDKVRISWPTGGAPGWKINDDVAFLRIRQQDDSINRQRDINFNNKDNQNSNMIVTYTNVYSVNWIFYGPNSYDNAKKVKNALFLSQYKEQLKQNNLFLIPDIAAPSRVPELYNNQWWERTDFQALYNEYVRFEQITPNIESADVQIKESR